MLGVNIKDFSRLISKNRVNDVSGRLYVNILIRYSYLIVDPKYPKVKAIILQHASLYNIIRLKVPVNSNDTVLRFAYDMSLTSFQIHLQRNVRYAPLRKDVQGRYVRMPSS